MLEGELPSLLGELPSLKPSLKLTANAPENRWKMKFLLGWPIFRGQLLVFGRVYIKLFGNLMDKKSEKYLR